MVICGTTTGMQVLLYIWHLVVWLSIINQLLFINNIAFLATGYPSWHDLKIARKLHSKNPNRCLGTKLVYILYL